MFHSQPQTSHAKRSQKWTVINIKLVSSDAFSKAEKLKKSTNTIENSRSQSQTSADVNTIL